MILVLLHCSRVTGVPLKVTLPLPCTVPKFVPAIVTEESVAPVFGVSEVITGVDATVKFTPALDTPPAIVTTTFPLLAPAGTATVMLPALHELTVAAVPLKLTVLPPCVAPKLEPAITTDEPTAPLLGVIVLMLGGGTTVKLTPALGTPDTVTTTLPVLAPAGATAVMLLALHDVTLAVIPLKLTLLVPGIAPKFEPAITTDEPTGPELGERLLIAGAATLAVVWNVVMSCVSAAEELPAQVAVCTPVVDTVPFSDSAPSPELLLDNCTAV